MRALIGAVGLLAGTLVLFVHSPSAQVSAQDKSAPATQPVSKVEPQKEAQIRELMDVT